MDESIQNQWRNVRFRNGSCDSRIDDIMDGRRRTALENLKNRYLRFSNFSLVMSLVPVQFLRMSIIEPHLRVWIFVAFSAFFLLCCILDRWFYRGIKSIDVASMPISVVASLALYYRKRHLQSVAVLLPLVAGLIGFMTYATGGDVYFMAGMCLGGIVGLVIGLRKLLNFMSDYRDLLH